VSQMLGRDSIEVPANQGTKGVGGRQCMWGKRRKGIKRDRGFPFATLTDTRRKAWAGEGGSRYSNLPLSPTKGSKVDCAKDHSRCENRGDMLQSEESLACKWGGAGDRRRGAGLNKERLLI